MTALMVVFWGPLGPSHAPSRPAYCLGRVPIDATLVSNNGMRELPVLPVYEHSINNQFFEMTPQYLRHLPPSNSSIRRRTSSNCPLFVCFVNPGEIIEREMQRASRFQIRQLLRESVRQAAISSNGQQCDSVAISASRRASWSRM